MILIFNMSKQKQLKELEKERDYGYKKIAQLQLEIVQWGKYVEKRQEEIIKLKSK